MSRVHSKYPDPRRCAWWATFWQIHSSQKQQICLKLSTFSIIICQRLRDFLLSDFHHRLENKLGFNFRNKPFSGVNLVLWIFQKSADQALQFGPTYIEWTLVCTLYIYHQHQSSMSEIFKRVVILMNFGWNNSETLKKN